MSIYKLIESSGPGQINEVLSDIKTLVNDDSTFTESSEPHLVKYNNEQFMTVDIGADRLIPLCADALDGDRYKDAISGKSFIVDHTSLKPSSIESYEAETIPFIAQLKTYVEDHYPSSAAYSVTPTEDGMTIIIVGNKYNMANYWTGRWRSSYHVDREGLLKSGWIKVDVHYYENGNIRLLTHKECTFDDASSASSSSSSREIISAIERAEAAYTNHLNRGLVDLGETQFKELRRALPITRSKINWASISSLRIGQDVQQASSIGRARP